MTWRVDSQRIHFTADPHFFHRGVIQYANRPFIDVTDMNNALVTNWNSVVGQDDIVFLLGDVSFGRTIETVELLCALNGTVHLIRGNHDPKHMSSAVKGRFASIHDLLEIDAEEPGGTPQRITLCHYAMRVWNRHHYGAWQLHGHSHGNLEPIGRQLDVGVDCHGYKPISYDTVKSIIMSRPVHTVDHHTPKVPAL